MFKSIVLLSVLVCVIVEARPKWQYLPAVPGYVPVYIQSGDTPLEEINPELAEAFHALPSGRSASKQIEASPDVPEDIKEDPKAGDAVVPLESVDHRPYEKKLLEKKKKASGA